MNKRKVRKAIKRIKYLPKNKYLFYYLSNKVKSYFLKLIKSPKVAYPSTIMLELTNHCNLNCTICPREYQYGKEMDKGMMNVQMAKDIIDEVWPYLDSIGLTGMGETFMYKQLEEIVDYIKRKNKGIVIAVSTNAVLPNFIEKTKNLIGKIDTIQISIDGVDEVYNSIRVGSSFEQLDKNLRTLIKLSKGSSTDIMLNMVVTKENYKHMSKLVEYADSTGVEYVDFTLFNLASVTEYSSDYYDFYESKEFSEILSELEITIQKSDVLVNEKNFKTKNSFQKCPFPWNYFYITQDGYVPPCCAKPFPKEKNFGNVANTSLMSVLNNDEIIAWRELWFENKTPKFCENCHFVNIKPINQKDN